VQSVGQLMPAGDEVTVPVPLPVSTTSSVYESWVNVAVTARAALIVRVQKLALLTQSPVNPANENPAAGVASSVTDVPAL
jgi:hypothetical protein